MEKIEKLRELLCSSKDKHDIDRAVFYVMQLLENDADFLKQEIPLEILAGFSQKIYTHIFAHGDIAPCSYLALYALFLHAPDALSKTMEPKLLNSLDALIRIARGSLFAENVSDNENVMLIELLAECLILQGRCQEAMDAYLQNIMLVDIHCLQAQKNIEFLLPFFEKCKIPFEVFAKNLRVVLEDRFDILTPKQKRSVFNWQLHTFWNVKHFFNHRGWLEFYPIWKEKFMRELVADDSARIDFALYLQFFIYHICGNNYSSQAQWREFNQEITLPATKVYSDFAKQFALPSPTAQNSGVIGILRDRLVENSPYKVEYSFLKTLLSDKKFQSRYKIKLYLMSFLEKSDNDKDILQSYRDLGIEVVDILKEQNQALYYNSHLSKALLLRQKMLEDQVEVLISPNNGYGISDFLLAARVCHKQIFWSHGNFVYDHAYLDGRVTHICGGQPKILHEGYEFVGIPVKMDNAFYNPCIPEHLVRQARVPYPLDAKILGNMGRLVKIDSLPFLQTVIEILRANKSCIFLACGAGNVEEIQQKITQIDKDMLSRFYFPGFVDSRIFGHVIDLWLDSFPMQQGESRAEYAAKGKPTLILTQESKQQRKGRLHAFFAQHRELFVQVLQGSGVSLESMKNFVCEDEDFVAFDMQDYVKKACNLIMMEAGLLAQKMLYQNLLKNFHDALKERDGKKAFLEIL
ncbi:Uncharacterised protein [Helicobacter mustelae]|uniref:hypothetical protein n=1 Tax=Helicobacter mustelae TaxID=217 RepID=UPI000DF96BF9|nr:hypothetical protein [Helicobacter mustelae]STP11951.1 Uncharacterised protein [Helicobacter mustelae]